MKLKKWMELTIVLVIFTALSIGGVAVIAENIDLGTQGRSTVTLTTTASIVLAANTPTARSNTPVSVTFQNVGGNPCYVWAGNTNDSAQYGYYLPASGGSVTLTPPHIDQRRWSGAATAGATTVNVIREFPSN
jgi:hypothetical protein